MSTAKRSPGKLISLASQAAIPDGAVVVIGTADLSCALPAGASPTGVALLGLAVRDGGGSYASGDTVDVCVEGIYAGVADGTITRGDRVTSGGTDGGLITAAPSAGTNCTVVGVALASAVAGDRFPVLIQHGVMQG